MNNLETRIREHCTREDHPSVFELLDEVKDNKESAIGLGEIIAIQKKENTRLCIHIQGAFAAHGLMAHHRESPGSWPRDRFEGWLDAAAKEAGIEVQGAATKPKEWWSALLTEAANKVQEKPDG